MGDRPPRAPSYVQSDDDRALSRRRTPAGGSSVPDLYEDEDFTGQFETGEIDAQTVTRKRAQRPTPIAIAHLQKTQHEHSKILTDLSVTVGEVKVHLEHIPKHIDRIEKIVDDIKERDKIELHAHLEMKRAEEIAEINVSTAQELDKVQAKSERRKTIYKLIVAAVSGGTIAQLVHRFL